MMYGALKSVFSNGKVKKHLNRNKKEHNGIAAWISMLTEYDHDGDTGVLIDKYDNMINTKFHRKILLGSQVSSMKMKLPLLNSHI